MKQLSVFVENKVGSMAQVTTALAKQNINLKAISVFDSPDFSILRMIVDVIEEAENVLKNEGFAVGITEVLAIELCDKPGSLNFLLQTMEKSGININYIYSFVYRQGDAPYMVLHVDNRQKALKALEDNHIKVVN